LLTCIPLFALPASNLQESVALLLKQPALIGLDASELRARLSGLAAAVGCEQSKAARLAAHSASLIMLHPDYVKVGRRIRFFFSTFNCLTAVLMLWLRPSDAFIASCCLLEAVPARRMTRSTAGCRAAWPVCT
jgi:hypothetical protein